MFSNSGPPDRNENRTGRSLSSTTEHTTSPATNHLMIAWYYDANRAIEPDLLARTERSAQQTPARWREGYQPWRRLWRLMVYSLVTTSSFLAAAPFFSAISSPPLCSEGRRFGLGVFRSGGARRKPYQRRGRLLYERRAEWWAPRCALVLVHGLWGGVQAG